MLVCAVFISKFKILWDVEEKEPACGGLSPERSEDGSPSSASEAPLDDDGDLDVARRPRDASPERERVCPIILRQATGTSTDGRGEDDDDEEEEEEATPQDVIRIGYFCLWSLSCTGSICYCVVHLVNDLV